MNHRQEFRNRVRSLQREEFGGNFEEALLAAVADALADDETDASESGVDAGPVDGEPEVAEVPKKRRGRPPKVRR